MGYIYEDWKKLLDNFQNSVEKDLAEIHQKKAEVEQIKSDLLDKMGEGLFYRDNNRIVISAPEIVIGNVDKSGDLRGFGRVIVKGNEISEEGVGEFGKIISRAPSIRQVAVDPGIDGVENVVCSTSEIVSQATSVVLHSSDAKDAFSQAPLIAGKGGIRIHADNHLELEAAVSAEGRKEAIDNQVKSLKTRAEDLKKRMEDQKKAMNAFFKQMSDMLDKEEKLNDPKNYMLRTSLLDIEKLHEQMDALMPSLCRTTAEFIHTLSQLAEVNRQKKALETEKDTIKTGDDFKTKTTGASMTIKAENIQVATTDGDGNLHTNTEAGISIQSPRFAVNTDNGSGKLVEDGGFSVNAQNISLTSVNLSDDGKEQPVTGKVNIKSKTINMEAIDYQKDDKGIKEKGLTADGKVSITAKTVEVATTNPKDIERDDKGKVTKGEYTAEGDVIIKSKTVSVESLDYEVAPQAARSPSEPRRPMSSPPMPKARPQAASASTRRPSTSSRWMSTRRVWQTPPSPQAAP